MSSTLATGHIPSVAVDFPWPIPAGYSRPPVWTGRGFEIDGAVMPVLSYEVGSSGWTDELTSFHEETAGANHPIDQASRRHTLEQLEKYVNSLSPAVLEVGCSSGFMLRLMRERLPQAFVMGS